jgi:hypothetical protein
MHKVVVGSNCNSSGSSTGNISANTDRGGATSGTVNSTSSGSTNCADEYRWLYTIKAGEQTYVLTPAHNALATKRGIGALFFQKSTLTNQLPGTPIKTQE